MKGHRKDQNRQGNREWIRLRKAYGATGYEEKRTTDEPAVVPQARDYGGKAADLGR